MNNLPGISCYCATYGRPKFFIENSIQCFLDQDWLGPKELVILNDCKYQKFFFDHPEIKIHNIDDKISLLGRKFNETIKLCSYDFIATWEDDDTFLKHRLSYSFNYLKYSKIFHTNDGFIEKKYKHLKRSTGYYHSTHLMSKNLFYDAGKYDEIDTRSIDIKLMRRISDIIGKYSTKIHTNLDIFYIYNWLFDSFHASSSLIEQHKISSTIEQQLLKKIDSGKIDCGNIVLEPKLRYNYYDHIPV